MRPATEPETNRAFALDDRHVATTAAAAVLGTAGGALAGAVTLPVAPGSGPLWLSGAPEGCLRGHPLRRNIAPQVKCCS